MKMRGRCASFELRSDARATAATDARNLPEAPSSIFDIGSFGVLRHRGNRGSGDRDSADHPLTHTLDLRNAVVGRRYCIVLWYE